MYFNFELGTSVEPSVGVTSKVSVRVQRWCHFRSRCKDPRRTRYPTKKTTYSLQLNCGLQ